MPLKPIVRALVVPVLGLSLSGIDPKDQPDLFDDGSTCGTEDEAKKLRRNADPATSKEAARLIVPKLGQLQQEALDMVVRWPGKTQAEFSHIDTRHKDSRRIGRRLPELVALGKLRRGAPRKCTVTGRSATTWWPA